MEQQERWIRVPKDNIEVSSFGNVRDCDTLALVELKINEQGYKYLYVSFLKRQLCLHRLIYFLFTGVLSTHRNQIDHYDGNKLNNRLDNLVIGSSGANNRSAYRNGVDYGVYSRKKGERNPKAKLTEDAVNEIRRLNPRILYDLRFLANKYEVSVACIEQVRDRITWKHLK